MNPVWEKRRMSFAKNRRAMAAAVLFLSIFIVSLFSEFLANDKPLVIKYKNEFYKQNFKKNKYLQKCVSSHFDTIANIITSNQKKDGRGKNLIYKAFKN